MLKNAKILFITLLILILSISIYGYFNVSDWHTTLRIIGRYALVLLSLIGGGIITYSFFNAIFDKHKKKISICCSLTATSMVIGITIYLLMHQSSKVVYMKEDVLYIHPSTHNDIYDGSANDPNFKQDTTNQ